MNQDETLDMAQNVMELDDSIRQMIELINENIEEDKDTVEVPTVALRCIVEMLNQANTSIKSLYAFYAAVGDAVQKADEE